MKISEFAKMNQITTKMLRHYDEIGLLKPSAIDTVTGYRSYEIGQCHYLNWILILKNLDFSLAQIKEMLSGPVSSENLIHQLLSKRIEISSTMNEQVQKKLQIDKLIKILEKEGFKVEKNINLLTIEQENVHEVKKNMPNMEMFLEGACNIVSLCKEGESFSVLRFDLCHFKQVNDNFGFDVGDKVIVASYTIIKNNIEKLEIAGVIGRAHGDEFVAFMKGDKETAEKMAKDICYDMEQFDFSTLGCQKEIGCHIGGLTGTDKAISSIRNMIDNSIEAIEKARKNGKNSIFIEG